MAKAIHMMLRVLDEGRSTAFYARAFGLAVADRFDFDDFTLVYLSNPEADLARFFFVEDPDGYKIEVLQRDGRYC